MTSGTRTLVAVATYNEIENLPRLVDEIFEYAPDVRVLVIDDNSPDGTGLWCDKKAAQDERVECLHRPGKLGLGTATIAGFRYAVQQEFDFVITMDADFSHHPRYLPKLRAGLQTTGAKPLDVIIGSRYVRDGGIEGWPLYRRWMSRAVNSYARLMLGLSVKDCSGAFRCYRTTVLRQLDLDQIQSRGYSYLEEILWRLADQGAQFGETPIVFVDRQLGKTKIDWREAVAAVFVILRLGTVRCLRLITGR